MTHQVGSKLKLSDIKLELDIQGISKSFGDLGKKVEKDLIEGANNLAKMSHAHIVDEANNKLGSLSEIYKKNLPLPEKIEMDGEVIWLIKLKEPANWIEDGYKGGFMQHLLEQDLKSSDISDGASVKGIQTSKDGHKYRAIPFKHNQPPTTQSSNAMEVANEIKKSMKEQGISWGKIEKDADGSPRVGKLHSFSVDTARNKKDPSGTPYGKNVSVFQTRYDIKEGPRKGKTEIRKDILTFRVISDKSKEDGKWVREAREGVHFFEEIKKWAEDYWKSDILPAILKQYE